MLSALMRLAARALATLRPGHLDRDLDQELASHLTMLEEEHRRRGMAGEPARRAALLELGGVAQLREAHRDVRGWPLVDECLRDLRYALRGLRRNPGFGTVAVLTLAIGIGANTAMFSLIHGVLLQPLDYPEPDRLVHIARGNLGEAQDRWITLARVDATRAAARSFTGLGAFFGATEDVAMAGAPEPEALKGARVSANFLDILDVRPALGRGFLPEEDRVGGPPVAMISAALWRRRFAADASLAGKTVMFNATPYTIVGVLPAAFRFPFPDVDVWFAQPNQTSLLPPQFRACCVQLRGFARLKPGVGLEQARAELDVLSEQYRTANPRRLDVGPLRLAPMKDELTIGVSTMLWMLLAAVAFVLLIACANVATLLMARATSRSREFAVRTALGAGRGRLVRQLLTESVVLSAAGGALGLLLAWLALDAVTRMTLFELPRAGEIHLSGVVLGFALALSIVTGVVFGTVPSWQILRPGLVDTLRQSGATDSLARRGTLGFSTRGMLVVVQVALSIVLLVGAALMLKSLARLASVDPGFQPANLLTMRIALPAAQYDTPGKRAAFFDDLVRRVEVTPGVRGASVVRSLPTTGNALSTNLQIVSQPIPEPGRVGMMLHSVTPGSFQVLGIPLRRGRAFAPPDNVPGAPPVVIVNESFARRFWPGYPAGAAPLGERLRVPILGVGQIEIVGVVGDVRHGGVTRDAGPQFYLPKVLYPPQVAYLAVRTDGDPVRSIGRIRAAVLATDSDQPVADIRLMDDVLEASVGQRHLAARLLALFAGAALLLAMVGIYGVLAYSVAQRTQEIGIRRTLGAKRRDILRLVLGQALGLTLAGVVGGLTGAFAFTRLLGTLLFQVSSTDPATFAGVAVMFLAVALIAGLVPAWRAVRIEPMTALRL